jgi:membrane protease subunit HflK
MKNFNAKNGKIRLFPVIFGITASIFINILAYYRNGCAVLSSLGSFVFNLSLFLVLITVIYEINKHDGWFEQKCFVYISEVFRKFSIKRESVIIEEKKETPRETVKTEADGQHGDLFEIKRDNNTQPRPESVSLEKRICSGVFIVSFLCLAFWRARMIFKVFPLSYIEDYHPGIIDAVLLLIFPCIAVLYLKMRKAGGSCPDSCPTDKFSRDILNFFSYISFIYAGIITAAFVLKINIFVILQWVYYAASVYLLISLAVNVLLSILKGNILSFEYSLFPENLFSKGGFADSEAAANWKISLKSLYTIRYTLKILPALVLALVFVLFVSTSVFVVQPHQQAAVYRFGKLEPSSIKDAGFHFKFPWPADKAEIYDVHRASSMQIGYESSGSANFLWTQMHDGGEHMLLLGNGNEMVAVNLKIIYVISDLFSYIKNCTNAEAVLSAAAYNALMTRTINTTLDLFLNVDRNSLSESVLNELSDFCKSEKLGFSVVQVIIENIHPPVDIADVYQKVVSASVDKTTAITRAQGYAGAKVIDAARQSRLAADGAMAMRHSRTSDARKEAAVFYAAADAYRISPGSYELTKRLDVQEKIIKGNKVYVFSRGTESAIPKLIIGKVNTVNLTDPGKGEGNE